LGAVGDIEWFGPQPDILSGQISVELTLRQDKIVKRRWAEKKVEGGLTGRQS